MRRTPEEIHAVDFEDQRILNAFTAITKHGSVATAAILLLDAHAGHRLYALRGKGTIEVEGEPMILRTVKSVAPHNYLCTFTTVTLCDL